MKVLVIEDDELYLKAIRAALADKGYDVYFTSNSSDAIRRFQQRDFDLVITDIFMPEKEGIELIQEIRDIHPTVKIIAISSGGSVGHTSFLEIAEATGANTTLKKPFTPDQIIKAIYSLQ